MAVGLGLAWRRGTRQVLPMYANTHTTTSVTGLQSTCFRMEARQIIAQVRPPPCPCVFTSTVKAYQALASAAAVTALPLLVHAPVGPLVGPRRPLL